MRAEGLLLPRAMLKTVIRASLGFLGFFVLLAGSPLCFGQELLDYLATELQRNFTTLQQKGDPKPYYLSYGVTQQETAVVDASFGALRTSDTSQQRVVDVSIRLDSPRFDNYHRVRGARARFTSGSFLPLEDKPAAIYRILWRDTDRAYRAAVERLAFIRSNQEAKVEEKDQSPDFSTESATTAVQPAAVLRLDRAAWEPRLRKWSALLKGKKGILTSQVRLTANADTRYFVDTDGARIRHGRTFARLTISAQAKAFDGMNLGLDRSFEAETPDGLPGDGPVEKAINELTAELQGLLNAPVAEPFVGPAILSGSAAAVFFHEIFGHRMEGHRQKDETEGQTFTEQVGKPVLPPFLSVYSDPTQKLHGQQDLMGWYAFDDEGIAARRVPLVENGILRNFMMSRSPIAGFPNSNGHGRRSPGNEVVSRQSNLLVQSTQTVPEARLREMLVDQIRRQNKPYGLYFAKVTGGFTTTGRAGLQAFTVIPLVVYRVYADGRPDELVRGVDIVGTPLASFAKILAASDTAEVFNGFCGAESGNVPVAAVSPAILVSEIETQMRAKAEDRPPLLMEPTASAGGAQ
jgi:predicted Zn-dependent protease